MKKSIISRYELTEKKEVIIDASLRSVEDLYNYFDRTADYLKKDLDQEFVDYVTDCVREIGKRKFVIRISLSTMPDRIVMDRVRRSIQTFFLYLQETEKRQLRAMLRRSLILFAIGLTLLVPAIAITRRFSTSGGVLAEVFAQGLTVAAWVSLWEAIANLFIEWYPRRQEIKRYGRVTMVPVIFRRLPQSHIVVQKAVLPKS